MRLILKTSTLASALFLAACIHTGPNPADPYEPINREIHKFNMAVDATMLKPFARVYKAVLPGFVRVGVNNALNNLQMPAAAASDLLQGDWRYAIKDSWRFLINSSFGVAGVFDVAAQSFGLPPHYNDLGLTLAKWGDKNSPYIVIPLLGPSTIRDGMALPFQYMITPYPYFRSDAVIYSLLGLRYLDLRSELLDSEPMINEAMDQYAFFRDAYLQHRQFLISGEKHDTDSSMYIDEDKVNDYVDE